MRDLVALAAIAALLVVIVALVGVLRSQQRAHARREDLLVNQLLHAVGRDWQPAPAAELAQSWRDQSDDARRKRMRAVRAAPEQYPVD